MSPTSKPRATAGAKFVVIWIGLSVAGFYLLSILRVLLLSASDSDLTVQITQGLVFGGAHGVAPAVILRRRVDWWIQWSAVTFVAFSSAFVVASFVTVSVLSIYTHDLYTWSIYAGIAGTIGGLGQWIVLRRYVDNAWPIVLASAIGLALGWTLKGLSDLDFEASGKAVEDLSYLATQLHLFALLLSDLMLPLMVGVVMNELLNRPNRNEE